MFGRCWTNIKPALVPRFIFRFLWMPASDAIDKDQLTLSNNCRRCRSRCRLQNLPVTQSIYPPIPGKQQSLIHSWVNDGSPSTALARHWFNNGWMCLAFGDPDWNTETLFSFPSTRHQSKAFPMLDQRRRRWSNTRPASDQCLVFAG